MLNGTSERPTVPVNVLPYITDLRDALGHCAKLERRGTNSSRFDFLPRARSRNWRAGLRSHSIRCSKGRAITVSPSVHKNAPRAIYFTEFECEVLRILFNQ